MTDTGVSLRSFIPLEGVLSWIKTVLPPKYLVKSITRNQHQGFKFLSFTSNQ